MGYFDAFLGVHFFELAGRMKHFRVNVSLSLSVLRLDRTRCLMGNENRVVWGEEYVFMAALQFIICRKFQELEYCNNLVGN